MNGSAMTVDESEGFFERAERLFGFDRQTIVGHNVALPIRNAMQGDLRD